jgi:hypothetical protein
LILVGFFFFIIAVGNFLFKKKKKEPQMLYALALFFLFTVISATGDLFKCHNPIDFLILLDASCGDNMDEQHCASLKLHLKTLVNYFDVGAEMSNSRVGIIAFDSRVYDVLTLDQEMTSAQINVAIDNWDCHSHSDGRDVVDAIEHAVKELEKHKRMVDDKEVDRAIFLYPICPCDECESQNSLCDTDKIHLHNLNKCHFSVLTSGLLAKASDYLCLLEHSIDSSNINECLVDNANWNPIIFAAEAYAFAHAICPPTHTEKPTKSPVAPPTHFHEITARPTWQPTPNPTTAPPTQAEVITERPTWWQPTPNPTPHPTTAPPTQAEVITERPTWWQPTPNPTPYPTTAPPSQSEVITERPTWWQPTPNPTPHPTTAPPTQAEVITERPTWWQPTPNPTPHPTTAPPSQAEVITERPTWWKPTPNPTPYPTTVPPSQSGVITERPTWKPTLSPTHHPTTVPPTQAEVVTKRPTWWGQSQRTDSPTDASGRYAPHPIHFDSDDSNGHVDSSSSEWSGSSSSSSSSDHNGLHWKMSSSSSD